MTVELHTTISPDPFQDAFYSTHLQIQIEDGYEEALSDFFEGYPERKGLDPSGVMNSVDELLEEVRALPYVLRADTSQFFYSFPW